MSGMSLKEWFKVAIDELGFSLDVRPPGGEPWTARILWSDVVRVCLKPEGLELSDGIYVFVRQRPESYVIPTEAEGGSELLFALADHGLFKHELIVEAMTGSGLYCWPPVDQ